MGNHANSNNQRGIDSWCWCNSGVVLKMKCEEFKEKYNKVDTSDDLSKLLDQVETDDMGKLYDALLLTNEWVSITLKDEYLMGFLKARLLQDD